MPSAPISLAYWAITGSASFFMASRSSNGTRFSLPAFSNASSLVTSSLDSSCRPKSPASLPAFIIASCKSLGNVLSVFTEKQIGRIDAGRLVFTGRDHAVLDGIVDLVIGNDCRRHAGGGKRLRPDRGALHAHL